MADQSTRRRSPRGKLPVDANFDAAWLRLRHEMEARIAARYGVASDDRGADGPDPDVLADMALERALMS